MKQRCWLQGSNLRTPAEVCKHKWGLCTWGPQSYGNLNGEPDDQPWDFTGGYSLQISVVLIVWVPMLQAKLLHQPDPCLRAPCALSCNGFIEWFSPGTSNLGDRSKALKNPQNNNRMAMICPWFPNGFCVHFHLFHIITGHHKPKKNISETFALRPALGPGSWREFGPCRYQDTLKYHVFIWLVVYLPLWKIWKSVGIIIPNIWKNKKCSKPPTSYRFFLWVKIISSRWFPWPKDLESQAWYAPAAAQHIHLRSESELVPGPAVFSEIWWFWCWNHWQTRHLSLLVLIYTYMYIL